MLGLAYYEADKCSGCGQSLSESAAPGGDAKDWLVTMHTCHSCQMLGVRQSADPDSKHASAHLWAVQRLAPEPGGDTGGH